jgi:hypothetical protein
MPNPEMSYRGDTQSRNYIPADKFKQDLTNALNEREAQRAQRAEQRAQYNKEATASYALPPHEQYAAPGEKPLYEHGQQNLALRMQEEGLTDWGLPTETPKGPIVPSSNYLFRNDVRSALDDYQQRHGVATSSEQPGYVAKSRLDALRTGRSSIYDIYNAPLY